METLATHDTPLNADTVAFCPYEGLQHLVACGCYELVPSDDQAQRIGRLSLLSTAGGALTEVCAVEGGGGVLDCSWVRGAAGGRRLLALASGTSMEGSGLARLLSLAPSDHSLTELTGNSELDPALRARARVHAGDGHASASTTLAVKADKVLAGSSSDARGSSKCDVGAGREDVVNWVSELS